MGEENKLQIASSGPKASQNGMQSIYLYIYIYIYIFVPCYLSRLIKGFYHCITKIFLLVGSYTILSWHL